MTEKVELGHVYTLCFPNNTQDSSIRGEGKALGAEICHDNIKTKTRSKYINIQRQGNDYSTAIWWNY